MSLVALKNAVIGAQYGTCSSANEETNPRRGSSRRDSDQATSRDSSATRQGDLESQTDGLAHIEADELSSSKRFRIDPRIISDATIGLSDGLTVPFALTAGLSALGDTRVVIFGGLAELIAGAISMGLGGYLGAKSELASYKETHKQTQELVRTNPKVATASIRAIFEPYGVPAVTLDDLATHLAASPPQLVDFLVRFDHCAEAPASSRALVSAMTIALGYFLGGLLPLIPYFFVGRDDLLTGLWVSVAVMAVTLFAFGYAKTCVVTGWGGHRCVLQGVAGGVQMVVVGGAAAGAAMGLVKFFDGLAPA